jgi:hypothetical protein
MIGTGSGIGIGAGNGLLSNTWGAGEELFKNDYFVHILEQVGGDFLRNQIDQELWPEGGSNPNRVFNYFSGTITNKPYSGNSFYNTSSTGWVSIQTTGAQGWGGGGYAVGSTPVLVPKYYYNDTFNFHVALKATQDFVFELELVGINNSLAKLSFGSSQGGSEDYYLPRDGKWHSFDIPASVIASKGYVGSNPNNSGEITNQGYLNFIFPANPPGGGLGIEVDATFFYNPNAERVTQQAQAPAAPEAPAAPPEPSYTDLPVPEGPALPVPTGQLLTGYTLQKAHAQESWLNGFVHGTNPSATGFDLFNFCFNIPSNKAIYARATYHEQGDTYNIRYDVVKNTCPYNPKVLLKTSQNQTVAQGALEISTNSDLNLGTYKYITVTPNIADIQVLYISFEWELASGYYNPNCDNEEFRFGVENFEVYKS